MNPFRATPFRALIFDLDGTLLDTIRDIEHSVNDVRAGHGLAPLTQEMVRAAVGKGVRVLLTRTVVPDAGLLAPAAPVARVAALDPPDGSASSPWPRQLVRSAESSHVMSWRRGFRATVLMRCFPVFSPNFRRGSAGVA